MSHVSVVVVGGDNDNNTIKVMDSSLENNNGNDSSQESNSTWIISNENNITLKPENNEVKLVNGLSNHNESSTDEEPIPQPPKIEEKRDYSR